MPDGGCGMETVADCDVAEVLITTAVILPLVSLRYALANRLVVPETVAPTRTLPGRIKSEEMFSGNILRRISR